MNVTTTEHIIPKVEQIKKQRSVMTNSFSFLNPSIQPRIEVVSQEPTPTSKASETDEVVRTAPLDLSPPSPPSELPLRFLRAGKNDVAEGRRRYEMTLAWRKEIGMDHQIRIPNPNFELVKEHYPQYFHLRGRNNEPVWYERPAGVNLKALRELGVGVDELLLHYATMTEFGWQFNELDDMARSITVIDMEGVRLADFAGEVVDFTRKCSVSTGDHYPERAGHVIIVNVPYWFSGECTCWADDIPVLCL